MARGDKNYNKVVRGAKNASADKKKKAVHGMIGQGKKKGLHETLEDFVIALVRGDADEAAEHLHEVMAIKTRAILLGEQDEEEVSDEEMNGDEEEPEEDEDKEDEDEDEEDEDDEDEDEDEDEEREDDDEDEDEEKGDEDEADELEEFYKPVTHGNTSGRNWHSADGKKAPRRRSWDLKKEKSGKTEKLPLDHEAKGKKPKQRKSWDYKDEKSGATDKLPLWHKKRK